MEAETKVKLLSLEPYRHLFPKAFGIDKTVKMGASVADTVNFIPQVVKKTAWQVKKFVAQELSGMSLPDACKKLWWWVKYHIEYRPDVRGLEQVRSPRRLIHDGYGDCDCMTTFIHCCLFVLKAKRLDRRITEYDHLGYFQHIYTIVPNNGREIIMDTVWNEYNKEKKYTKKEDYTMELQFLDGIGESENTRSGIDALAFQDDEVNLGELGKFLKRAKSGGGSAPAKKGLFKKPLLQKPLLQKKTPEQKAAKKEKRKAIGKKVLKVVNKVNKINPGIALLRAGILASMKLNVLKIAERIKWGYATPEYAESKGMDMSKYGKVKEVLAKAEKVFFAAGGKPENLRKAILTGNGNRNREVAGIEGYNDSIPLPELLGTIYTDEFINGMEGFEGFGGLEGLGELGQLGEPATAASVAAASSAMGALAALLKSIGDLFPNKGKKSAPAPEAPSEEQGESEAAPSEPNVVTSSEESASQPSAESESTDPLPAEETENLPSVIEEQASEVMTSEGESSSTEESPEEVSGILSGPLTGIKAFYQQHKNWLVPVGVVVAIAAVALAVSSFSKENSTQPTYNPQNALNGVKRKKQRNKKGRKNKGRGKAGEKSVIALM